MKKASKLQENEKEKYYIERIKTGTTTGYKNKYGSMSLTQFSNTLMRYIKQVCVRGQYDIPSFSIRDILINNPNYVVKNTIVGDLIFPMMLTNGYHNSASFNRINSKLGYITTNIEIRPCFLNNTKKMNIDDFNYILKMRRNVQSDEELCEIAKHISSIILLQD